MIKELKSLAKLESFGISSRPRDANMLQSKWAFRKKCYPDGTLKTYKAQFCVRGSQQIDVLDVCDTYTPVVS